jgi:hypothetical protein
LEDDEKNRPPRAKLTKLARRYAELAARSQTKP